MGENVMKLIMFYPIKINQHDRKIRRSSLDFVHSTSRYTYQRLVFSLCLLSSYQTTSIWKFKKIKMFRRLLTIMDSYGNLTLNFSSLLINKEMLKSKFLIYTFRLSFTGIHFKIFFRSLGPLLRRSPTGATRRRVQQRFFSYPRRSSAHRSVDWRLWEINYGGNFFTLT